MTERFVPVEPPVDKETGEQVDFAEILRRARAPIIREGFAEPWVEDAAAFDPAQAGWEQAAENILAKIQEMQSSGLVQLTPEGLTPKQVAAKAGESAKLAEANKRAAELAEQLRQAAEEAKPRPPVEAPAASSRDQWGELPDDQRNAGLGEWFRKLQAGEQIEDWQRQALKDFNIWGGDSLPPADEAEEPIAEVVEVVAASVAGAGGKMRRFFESEKGRAVLTGAEFAAGGVAGVAIAEILKLGPGQEAGIVIAAQSFLGLSRLATEIGARAVEGAEARFPKFARLSARLAGEKGLVGVLRGVKTVATRIQYRPFVVGLSAGIIGHSAFEMITGHSIFPDVNAVESTTGPAAANTETPTATATETPMGTPVLEATPTPGGATGGLPPDERGGGIVIQPPEEAVVPQFPQVPVDAGEAQLQAAEAAQRAAEAARQAALETATRVHAVNPNETLSAIVSRYGGDPMGVDMTHTVVQSAGELTSGTDLAGGIRQGAAEATKLIEYLNANPTVTWRQAINEGLKTAGGESVAKLFADATRMIFSGKLLNVVVGAAVP